MHDWHPLLKAVDYDVDHTVFSYIPNTAEVAYYGMLSGFKKYLNESKIEKIASLDHIPTKDELYEILGDFVRSEKIAWKDIKLRTFITEGNSRNDLASHVYDVTYGSIEPNVDNSSLDGIWSRLAICSILLSLRYFLKPLNIP